MSAANMPVPTLANSDTHTPRVYCLLEEQRTTLSARRGSLQRQLHGLPFTPVPHIVARLERLRGRGSSRETRGSRIGAYKKKNVSKIDRTRFWPKQMKLLTMVPGFFSITW